MNKNTVIKAVGMLSGGLDSMLATKVITEQGIQVTALHFRTGFSYVERDRVAGRGPVGQTDAERAAETLGVPLVIIDIADDYIPIVLDPRYGYGSGMNPCVDCRIFLLRRAKAWMEEHGHHFVFTGEVVGQRPKSQMKPSLRTVERESGLEGYLLRPLSAKLLRPTIPEERGWVKREGLHTISGRGRKDQIALAEAFGITEYAQPSGGCCYLIHQTYSRRLQDFLDHEGEDALSTGQVQLLAVGRHLRLESGRKVVVGRHERENEYLESSGVTGVLLATPDHPGPVTLVPGQPTWEEIEQAARITAGYSDGKDEHAVTIEVRRAGKPVKAITITPVPRENAQAMMV
jgi:tRNA U34 2-thiouridine synthase MnmA/TrmU